MARSINPRCPPSPPSSACRHGRRAPTAPRTRTSASSALGELVPFVQVDLPGAGWLPDGRYIVRAKDDGPETVLVSELIGSLPARGRLRGRKPVAAEPGSAPELPIRRLTYALPERFSDTNDAAAWLSGARDDPGELVERALAVVNRAIAAYRVSAGEASIHEPGDDELLAVRVGYGTGDEVAASRWTEAAKLPPDRRAKFRRPGTEDIRPQQRMAAILSGREQADPWELHAVRAQADFDAGRHAEAAAELRAAAASFDAAPPAFAGKLREEIAGRLVAARTALGVAGSLEPEALADAVDVFTRLQNRRRRPRADI